MTPAPPPTPPPSLDCPSVRSFIPTSSRPSILIPYFPPTPLSSLHSLLCGARCSFRLPTSSIPIQSSKAERSSHSVACLRSGIQRLTLDGPDLSAQDFRKKRRSLASLHQSGPGECGTFRVLMKGRIVLPGSPT